MLRYNGAKERKANLKKPVVKITKPKAPAMARHSFVVVVKADKMVSAAQVRRCVRSALVQGASASISDKGAYDPRQPIRVTVLHKEA